MHSINVAPRTCTAHCQQDQAQEPTYVTQQHRKRFVLMRLHLVNTTKVQRQAALSIEDFWTDVTFEGLDVTNTMNRRQVLRQVAFYVEDFWADAALEGLDVTIAMNGINVTLEAALLCKLPAANVALVSGVSTLGSTAALSMRRVVVSADRWWVAERHVTDLALDTRCPCLQP